MDTSHVDYAFLRFHSGSNDDGSDREMRKKEQRDLLIILLKYDRDDLNWDNLPNSMENQKFLRESATSTAIRYQHRLQNWVKLTSS